MISVTQDNIGGKVIRKTETYTVIDNDALDHLT